MDAEVEIPQWVQTERAHIRRVLLWTLVGTLAVGAITLGLLLLKTRWVLVPIVGLVLCQLSLLYAMARNIRLGFRIKRSGVTMPPPPRRAILGVVFFGALSFALGVLGIIQKQGPQIVYGLLGGLCMTWVLVDVRRKQRRSRE